MRNDQLEVLRAVNDVAARAECAGLLRGAIGSRLLEHCRTPTRPADLTEAMGLNADVLERVCDALCSLGVLADLDDGRVQISELYAPLLEAGLDQRALDRLQGSRVRAELLEDLFAPQRPSAYWEIDSAARVTLARNATADPHTEFGQMIPVAGVRADPEWQAEFDRGGRFLDLGCGVAGQIVSYLKHWPQLTAVGVDLADDLLSVARARARALGVSDRATFVHGDSATFRDPEPFDVVFWPQTFFTRASFAPVARTAFASLRPGGLLITITDGGAPARARPEAGVNLDDARLFGPVLRSLWDVPERTPDEVKAQLAEVGFVEITDAPPLPLITPRIGARRPADTAER